MKNYKITHIQDEQDSVIINKVELLENEVVDFINNKKKEVELPDEEITSIFSSYVKNGSHVWGLHIGYEFFVSPA